MKAAIRIAKDTADKTVFLVLTGDGGSNVWTDVSAEGFDPTLDVPYTFKFGLDCTNKTYTVSLVNGETETPLTAGSSNVFAFGVDASASPVREIGFIGNGIVMNLFGEYGDLTAFTSGEVLGLNGGLHLPDQRGRSREVLPSRDQVTIHYFATR